MQGSDQYPDQMRGVWDGSHGAHAAKADADEGSALEPPLKAHPIWQWANQALQLVLSSCRLLATEQSCAQCCKQGCFSAKADYGDKTALY